MPMITLQVVAPESSELAARLAHVTTEITSKILGKDPRVTAVAVEFVPSQHWFVGGRSLSEQGKTAFFLDVRITDGTNTKDEKARYVAAAFDALSAILGGVHEESYVHVDDVRADAYGYGGKTQERRFIERRVSASA
jgi:4-oxalocrotonate tautomerase